jgi:hypothetical protein
MIKSKGTSYLILRLKGSRTQGRVNREKIPIAILLEKMFGNRNFLLVFNQPKPGSYFFGGSRKRQITLFVIGDIRVYYLGHFWVDIFIIREYIRPCENWAVSVAV